MGATPYWLWVCAKSYGTLVTFMQVHPLLKDTENYPFIGDVIDQLGIGRTAFYRYFPTDRIKELRNEHSAKA